MSRGCPPLAVQAAGRVVSRWTPPTPPSASIHFIFRVCLGLFVRQSGDHHLLVFPKTNYAPDTTLKTLLWLSKNEHRRSAEGSQLRPGLPSFTSLLPCSTLPSALGRLRPTVYRLCVFMDRFFDSCMPCGWQVRSSILFFFFSSISKIREILPRSLKTEYLFQGCRRSPKLFWKTSGVIFCFFLVLGVFCFVFSVFCFFCLYNQFPICPPEGQLTAS